MKIKITENQLLVLENNESHTYKVYHGTNEKFNKFDLNKTAEGTIWFTDSIDSIKTGTHGGNGSKYIISCDITLNKPATWDDYEKYSIGELINEGFDGVILPEPDKVDYIIFYPENQISNFKYINNNLKEDTQTNNLNDNFYKWFGNSKIVGDSGKPLVCYHGNADKNIKIFDLDLVGKNTDSGMFGKGFYFTNDEKYATTYDRNNDGNILKVYLNISNPLIINSKNDIPKINTPEDTLEDMLNATDIYSKMFREYLIENGYDGVIDNMSGIKQFVALHPNQIKSIDNNGEWNMNNNNIYENKKTFKITTHQLKEIKQVLKENKTINNIQLPKFIVKSIESHKTSLGNHPSFPPEDETTFQDKLLKIRFDELGKNILKISDLENINNNKDLINELNNNISKAKQIEANIREELEKICFEYVCDKFNISYDELDIECVLTDTVIPKIKPNKEPLALVDNEFEEISHINNLSDEVYKRRVIDSLIQGASVRLSSDYSTILNKVYELNPKLPELYYNIIALNDYLSFVKEVTPSDENIGGIVSVDLSSDEPKIYSQAIIFPVLVFETIKGIMELVASHGLPSNLIEAEYVIGKADFSLAENWDRRFGVGLFDIINQQIGNENMFIDVFSELISLPTELFNSNLKEVFAKTKKGKQIINDIVQYINKNKTFEQFDMQLAKSDEDGYFTVEELEEAVALGNVGDISYDVPAFGDKETNDHSNLMARSQKVWNINEEEDYRMDHKAPGKEDSPMYDLINEYGEDIYSKNAARYYGDGVSYDQQSINIMQYCRNKPNQPVVIYRAVPKIITNEDKIADYEKQKAYIMKMGKLPPNVKNWSNRSEYYEFLDDEITRLKHNPVEQKVGINSGDWVTISLQYAKEHGERQFGRGGYKILKKTVPAKNLYSDGNSIHEWGYNI